MLGHHHARNEFKHLGGTQQHTASQQLGTDHTLTGCFAQTQALVVRANHIHRGQIVPQDR